MYAYTGVQLGIFNSRGLIHKKGASEIFRKRYSLRILFFGFISGETTGLFTDVIALKTNDSYCYSLSWLGRKNVDRGKAPIKYSEFYFFISGICPL